MVRTEVASRVKHGMGHQRVTDTDVGQMRYRPGG